MACPPCFRSQALHDGDTGARKATLRAGSAGIVLYMQVLHYSVESMQEKLQYLREIGMEKQQVAQSIMRLPQLLSLDVRHNMRPKYNYMQSQLGGNVQTLCSYPAYFSLSLLQRYKLTWTLFLIAAFE